MSPGSMLNISGKVAGGARCGWAGCTVRTSVIFFAMTKSLINKGSGCLGLLLKGQ